MPHLAQVNVAQMRGPLDDPIMAGFVARIAEINSIADASPGFVWRLIENPEADDYVRPFEDSSILFNLSVWESMDALRNFLYRTSHVELIRQRHEWVEDGSSWVALWWIEEGHVPTIAEAKERLEQLQANGDCDFVFSLKS